MTSPLPETATHTPFPYAKLLQFSSGALERALNSTPPSATAAWPAPTASIDAAAIAHTATRRRGSNPRVPITSLPATSPQSSVRINGAYWRESDGKTPQ